MDKGKAMKILFRTLNVSFFIALFTGILRFPAVRRAFETRTLLGIDVVWLHMWSGIVAGICFIAVMVMKKAMAKEK